MFISQTTLTAGCPTLVSGTAWELRMWLPCCAHRGGFAGVCLWSVLLDWLWVRGRSMLLGVASSMRECTLSVAGAPGNANQSTVGGGCGMFCLKSTHLIWTEKQIQHMLWATVKLQIPALVLGVCCSSLFCLLNELKNYRIYFVAVLHMAQTPVCKMSSAFFFLFMRGMVKK